MKKLLLAALAAPTPALSTELDDILVEIAAHASAPLPALSSGDRRRLAAGDTVTTAGWTDGAYQVAGLRVVAAPRGAVWAAVHDPAVVADPSVRELRLSADQDGTELWYGRMVLPLGLSDRHWVVRSRVHRAIAEATDGRAWERAWHELDDALDLALPALRAGHLDGVREAEVDDAIVTPTNRGAWLTVRLSDGRTLVATHATTDLGGTVPAWLVRDVAQRQVRDLLLRVARAAGQPHPDVVPGG